VTYSCIIKQPEKLMEERMRTLKNESLDCMILTLIMIYFGNNITIHFSAQRYKTLACCPLQIHKLYCQCYWWYEM